ncbi:MAG: hypothetical protein Q9168_007897 [Polycauliona sp. 1 TL-2023]
MDATITRKAFIHWFSHIYIPSGRGRGLSKNTRIELQSLLSEEPPNPIDRSGLSPETLEVISIWENDPIPFPSAQWRVARVRLIADLLLNGTLLELQTNGTLAPATPNEANEARCWIYQRSNGEPARYQPLAQPWCTKEIAWPYDHTHIKLADPSKALRSLPSAWTIDSLDNVRIGMEDFKQLVAQNTRSFRSDEYNYGQISLDDFSVSECDEETPDEETPDEETPQEETPQEEDPYDGVRMAKRINDWLGLITPSTRGCVGEVCMEGYKDGIVTPDIESHPESMEDVTDAEQSPSTPSPLPSQSIQWTPINRPPYG